MAKWRILVVDDESDVHSVTSLALKRRSWRGRQFDLVSTYSSWEATQLLKESRPFNVCLIDVVMETGSSGLELCQHIRDTQPRWTPIILRTGQPGRAPEAEVFRDFDIDYYLAKADLGEYRLYQTVCSSLRSSEDCAMLTAVTDQLTGYIKVIQEDDSTEQLVRSFAGTLAFIETKYGISGGLFAELTKGEISTCLGASAQALVADGALNLADVQQAIRAEPLTQGADLQPRRLESGMVAFPFRLSHATLKTPRRLFDWLYAAVGGGDREWRPSATVVLLLPRDASEKLVEKLLRELVYNLRLFCNAWKLAYELVCTQRALSATAHASPV